MFDLLKRKGEFPFKINESYLLIVMNLYGLEYNENLSIEENYSVYKKIDHRHYKDFLYRVRGAVRNDSKLSSKQTIRFIDYLLENNIYFDLHGVRENGTLFSYGSWFYYKTKYLIEIENYLPKYYKKDDYYYKIYEIDKLLKGRCENGNCNIKDSKKYFYRNSSWK